MIRLAATHDVRWSRSLPTDSDFPSRGDARNTRVQGDSDLSAALLEPACPQVGKLACGSILLLTNGYWETGHAFAFQMSAAYSAIVRSLENFPELATFKIALLDHPAGLAYRSCLLYTSDAA